MQLNMEQKKLIHSMVMGQPLIKGVAGSGKDYSSILFVADTAQSIYDASWLIKGRSFTSIGLDMTGKSNSLAKNYRTATQIAEAAYSLNQGDGEIMGDDNFVKPSLIDKQGTYPVFRFFTLEDEYELMMVNQERFRVLGRAVGVVKKVNG